MTVGTHDSIFQYDATGTRWHIETPQPLDPARRAQIERRVDTFERTFSRFRPDSLVSRIAAAPHGGQFEFPTDSEPLLELYDRLHEVTGGAFDALVGRDLERLGYDRTYTLIPRPPRSAAGP